MREKKTIRTRFAPSPTGDLHLGGALCALASFEIARGDPRGAFVVRMEDLDTPRVVAGSAERILDDLAWLGMRADEYYVQSTRISIYENALAVLERAGLTYPCDCSRAEIARHLERVASAPHDEYDAAYPGTCREKDPSRAMRRPPAIRFRAREAGVDDFVLRRGDSVFAYQLAVSVDDLAMAISVVVRGEDLAPSTPRQIAVMRALGARDEELPRYVHLPLARDARGERLSKRTAGGRIRALRDGGLAAKEILEVLARATDGKTPLVVPDAWARFGA